MLGEAIVRSLQVLRNICAVCRPSQALESPLMRRGRYLLLSIYTISLPSENGPDPESYLSSQVSIIYQTEDSGTQAVPLTRGAVLVAKSCTRRRLLSAQEL